MKYNINLVSGKSGIKLTKKILFRSTRNCFYRWWIPRIYQRYISNQSRVWWTKISWSLNVRPMEVSLGSNLEYGSERKEIHWSRNSSVMEKFTGLWVSFRDHYVPLSVACQTKQTLFRWRNTSVRLLNVAFVKSQIQHYFIDQFQVIEEAFSPRYNPFP